MRTLVRAIVASALEAQADALVLSAFGCGAHGHPPQEVASFFQDALTRAPIGVALFGIYDEPHHRGPHNPDGSMRPFRRWLLPDEPQSPRLGSPVRIPPPLWAPHPLPGAPTQPSLSFPPSPPSLSSPDDAFLPAPAHSLVLPLPSDGAPSPSPPASSSRQNLPPPA